MSEQTSIHTTASNPLVADRHTGVGVTLRNVSKDFGGHTVISGLDLVIEPGEFLSLLGPSGCGKTTILRLLAGLEHLSGGAILLDGADVSSVPTNHRDLGMVFQAYSLFPHLDALNNTMFGLRMRRIPRRDAQERAAAALDLVGLAGLGNRYPNELSGGQQQRVALARALVTEPRVLLLDEPLSALDAKVRTQLREEIRRIQLRLGITTVFVTHDQEEALAVSDRIAVMNSGRIEQIGTPETLYQHPASPIVADFVGLSSVLPGTARAGRVEVWGHELPTISPVPDGPVEVFVRPENIRFVNTQTPGAPAPVAATVQESIYIGSLRRTRVRTEDGTQVRVQHAAAERFDFGTPVLVTIDPVPVSARAVGAAG